MQTGILSEKKKVPFWATIKFLFEKFSQDDVLTYSASLAYFTALAIAPLVVLMISFLAFLNFDLQEQFLLQTRSLMGTEASQVFESILNSANSRPDLTAAAGWVGAIILALSASVVFAHLQTALNRIFEVPIQDNAISGFWYSVKDIAKRRLLSVGILLSFIFISIISLTVSAALAYIVTYYEVEGIELLSGVINFAVYSVLFSLIYKFMPDCQVQYRGSFIAGAVTAGLFILGKALIGKYLGQAAVGSAYGAAGSLVVLLAWIYYSSLVFFFGAEVSAVFVFKTRYR